METDNNKRRISFQVDIELRDRLDAQVPWGQRRIIFEKITKNLVKMLESNDSSIVIGAILSDKVKLNHISDYDKKDKDKSTIKTD